MTTQTYFATLTVMSCWKCGIRYGMDTPFYEKRRADRGEFFCPNGHGAVFRENDVERLTRELDLERKRKEWAENDRDAALEARNTAERSARAVRGHLTKVRRRAAAAVCPVEGCQRSFAAVSGALKRHIATKHPQWHAKVVEGS